MKPDREYQKEILNDLAKIYPNRCPKVFKKTPDTTDEEEKENKKVIANLSYLSEHGLIDSIITKGLGTIIYDSKITAQGIDFLADDGGLSAILGVVTIKLHDDTLRNLIEMKILASDLSEPDKKKWTDALRELPAESIKHLTMALLDKGLASMPLLLPLLEKCIEMQ